MEIMDARSQCARCGREFAPGNARRKYCSRVCKAAQASEWRAQRQAKPERDCPWCGQRFNPARGRKYCADRCMWAALAERSRRKAGTQAIPESAVCVQCGEEFPPSTASAKYCSRRCRTTATSAQVTAKRQAQKVPIPPALCARCGQEFGPVHPKQLFCTKECRSAAGVERAYFGEKAHGLAGTKQTPEQIAARMAATRLTLSTRPIECRWCQKSFVRSVGSQRFCSTDCGTKSARARKPAGDRIRIPRAQYDQLRQEQGGVCSICQGTNPSGSRLSVDHDHNTGAIRGLLCSSCNRGIGYLKDDIALVSAALAYLQHHRST